MLQRIKNLWAWSAINPYLAGQETGETVLQALKELVTPPKAEIVYPNKVREVLQDNPEASLDDLISR